MKEPFIPRDATVAELEGVIACSSYDSFGERPMPETLVLRGHGGAVKIEVFRYERPEITNGSDANWVVCRCGVTVREFSCEVDISMMTGDFIRFQDDLGEALRSLRGTAVLASADDGLYVEITFGSAGHADVIGIVQSRLSVFPRRTKLDFSFESDQSFLLSTFDGL